MREIFRKLIFASFFPLLLVGNSCAYNIILDLSTLPEDSSGDFATFLSSNCDYPFGLILPQDLSLSQKKLAVSLGDHSQMFIVKKLSPQVWVRGVGTLDVSDVSDVILKEGREFSEYSSKPMSAIFIGKQCPPVGFLKKAKELGLKVVFAEGDGKIYSSGAVPFIEAKPANSVNQLKGNEVFLLKPDDLTSVSEFFSKNPPKKFDYTASTVPLPSSGIILGGVKLKLWEMFKRAREDIENYKNSGFAKNDNLLAALDIAYEIENVANWNNGVNPGKVYYLINDIYNTIGKPVPGQFGKLSDIIFEQISKLPLSVMEKDIQYRIREKGGFLYIDGKYNVSAGTMNPVEIYWWNPSCSFATKKSVEGEDMGKLANYALIFDGSCYFYASSPDGWQRMWKVFTVKRSTDGVFSVKIAKSFFQLTPETNIQFFLKIGSDQTRPIAVSLGKSFVLRKWLDMVGDNKGPGWWELPDNAPVGIGDIMSLSVWKNSRSTTFQFYFAGPISGNHFFANADLYIDTNRITKKGKAKCEDGLNCFVTEDSYWEYCLRVSSYSANLLKGSRVWKLPVRVDFSKRIVTVKLPKKFFDVSPEKCRFVFLTYLVDKNGKVVQVLESKDSSHPGGGKPEYKSPNVLDIIAPSAIAQKRILSSYLKRRGVQIPSLP